MTKVKVYECLDNRIAPTALKDNQQIESELEKLINDHWTIVGVISPGRVLLVKQENVV